MLVTKRYDFGVFLVRGIRKRYDFAAYLFFLIFQTVEVCKHCYQEVFAKVHVVVLVFIGAFAVCSCFYGLIVSTKFVDISVF